MEDTPVERYYPRRIYSRPSLKPEETLSYPIVVHVRSLNDDYIEQDYRRQNVGPRSMIYFPRPSPPIAERCNCPECNYQVIEERRPYLESSIQKKSTDSDRYLTRSPSSPSSFQSSPSPDGGASSLDGSLDCPTATFPEYIDGSDKDKSPAPNDKKYVCNVCERGFTWFGNFQKHVLTHGDQSQQHPYFAGGDIPEDKIIIRESNNTFRCKLCNKAFTRMSGLRTHIRMHNGQRPFKCDHCALAFTTNRALRMHTRIHSGERPYKCTKCIKTFTRKDELQAHLYLHEGVKPFKCEKCPSAFVRHGHLQRHMLTHAEEKPYKCKSCPKSFTQYRNLQTHMYKHTGERPYKCRFCGKGFTQHGTVQAHERTHTGMKPYGCDQCEKRFITSSHLRWHVKKHHQSEEATFKLKDADDATLELKDADDATIDNVDVELQEVPESNP